MIFIQHHFSKQPDPRHPRARDPKVLHVPHVRAIVPEKSFSDYLNAERYSNAQSRKPENRSISNDSPKHPGTTGDHCFISSKAKQLFLKKTTESGL